MKIGYPCINTAIGCTANSTFRLASYTDERLISTVQNNLTCLKQILEYNTKNGILFFRISSDLVPFASHPVCRYDWKRHFEKDFKEIGRYIKNNDIRISMHPGQFVILNSPKKEVIASSIKELEWQCEVLDLMELDASAKVQIHLGGVYGDKKKAIEEFKKTYETLPQKIKKRLVIENDDKSFSVKDCMELRDVPILFDSFHHECNNDGQTIQEALALCMKTWKKEDGILMVDYSSQEKDARIGKHAKSIDLKKFKKFIQNTKQYDFDIMLEIKDKEKSAIKALKTLKGLRKI